MNNTPIVTIIGRINVGKSTLFNCLTESNKAIVSDIPETTRDRNYGVVTWRSQAINIIDTGGVDIDTLKNSIISLAKKKPFRTRDSIEKNVILQTQKAIQEASMILFVVDSQVGVIPQDKQLALILKKYKKPVMVVVNKVDGKKYHHRIDEFYNLGFGKPHPVSAISGSGSGDLLDEILKQLKYNTSQYHNNKETPIRIAIIGKPNVGKSSIMNKLVNEERVIVSEIPQTTREPQEMQMKYQDHVLLFIDTAGLKKRVNIQPGIDKIASTRTLQTIQQTDVALLVIEAPNPITKQDQALGRLILQSGSAVTIIANKSDLLEKDIDTFKKDPKEVLKKSIYAHLPHLDFAPIIFVSALTGQNVKKILDLIIELWKRRNLFIPDSTLASLLKKIIKTKKPIGGKGVEKPRIYSLTQIKTNPPEFSLRLGKDQMLHTSYLRFVENKIREKFNFEGINIQINITSYRKKS